MIENWGEAPDGSKIHRVKIHGDGLTACILNFGATLQDLRLNDHDFSLVLGYQEIYLYLKNPNYFGSTVGRYANRISNGQAIIGGHKLNLDRNFLSKHHLHGGYEGSSFRNWQIEDHRENSVTFCDILPDGHMGFPGILSVRTTFTVEDKQRLTISIEAQTDAPTLCNFTSHNYFNLDGSASIKNHFLQINAEQYVSVDEEGIPRGHIEYVADTVFDYRESSRLVQNDRYVSIDNNYCLLPTDDNTPVASLSSSLSGLCLTMQTNQPGLQVYSGSGIEKMGGFGPFAGIALEPQIWPDAPNIPSFPDAELRPDEKYHHKTTLCFTKQVF